MTRSATRDLQPTERIMSVQSEKSVYGRAWFRGRTIFAFLEVKEQGRMLRQSIRDGGC